WMIRRQDRNEFLRCAIPYVPVRVRLRVGLPPRRCVSCTCVDVELIDVKLAWARHWRAPPSLLVLICSEMTVPVFVPAFRACRSPLACGSGLQFCAKNKIRAGKVVARDCAGFCAALVRVPFRFFRFFRRGKTSALPAKHRCLLMAGELGFEP